MASILAEIGRLVIGYDVPMKARLGAVGVLSLADHAYAKVEAVDVGDRDGYDQSPMNDALELIYSIKDLSTIRELAYKSIILRVVLLMPPKRH
ncbi:hypothetical protein N0V83_003364 [Neocucurbitaria cava]|uniref:Uncharacterized protein n=1 Tax=Neocucurbitaria cava TaxID=798079 RepID=A0A9W8YDX5_9PLEO|nr:hypothetical protein N0V83_003364 [Neocucurbitaria cava]